PFRSSSGNRAASRVRQIQRSIRAYGRYPDMQQFLKRFAPAAAAFAFSMVAFAGAANAQQEIKLGYALATTSHYGVAATKWQEVVEAGTDGRFVFRHFPSSGLGGEREVIEGVQIGTVEATIVSS